jgi:3-oxoacyl-[acyl-carrier-protein] synthase II
MITGIGVVAPCGTGREDFWNGLLGVPEDLAVREVKGFAATDWMTARAARRADRFTQFALAAALMATEEAGQGRGDNAQRSGVVLGTTAGGFALTEEQSALLALKGDRAVSPTFISRIMVNAAAAAVAIATGRQGPCLNMATGCASGTHAIAEGAELIRSGRCDTVLAGGAEAALSPVIIAGFRSTGALSPTGRCLPFDRRRDGFVLSEGAAVLVLESAAHARARGARCFGEVLGWAATCDAVHLMIPDATGQAAAACLRLAISDAQLRPADIRHLNAHGTGTVRNDIAEAKAITDVFGAQDEFPLVTSVKGATGHALGAAGAIEAASVVLAMDKKVLPPTAGFRDADPECQVPVVRVPTAWEPGPTISSSFAFGGHNGSIVIGPVAADDADVCA